MKSLNFSRFIFQKKTNSDLTFEPKPFLKDISNKILNFLSYETINNSICNKLVSFCI
jgi:hypothetical protein